MFFSKSMAGGGHVGPPGETPKSPQSPEHVFGPEENKGTIVDTTRNDAKLLFPSNFKHLFTHYPRFWAKSRQLESMSRVGTNSLRAFGCSNSHRPRRLWRPRAKQLQCRAASTKLNLQTEAPTATVFDKSRFLDIFFADLHCKLQIDLFASAGDQTSQQLRCESPDHTTSSVVWVSPTALRALSVQSS